MYVLFGLILQMWAKWEKTIVLFLFLYFLCLFGAGPKPKRKCPKNKKRKRSEEEEELPTEKSTCSDDEDCEVARVHAETKGRKHHNKFSRRQSCNLILFFYSSLIHQVQPASRWRSLRSRTPQRNQKLQLFPTKCPYVFTALTHCFS